MTCRHCNGGEVRRHYIAGMTTLACESCSWSVTWRTGHKPSHFRFDIAAMYVVMLLAATMAVAMNDPVVSPVFLFYALACVLVISIVHPRRH